MFRIPLSGLPTDADSGRTAISLPLTEPQERAWHALQTEPGHPGYNTGYAVELRGALHVPCMARAVALTHREAVGLAVQVIDTGHGPRLVPARDAIALDVVDLTSHADPRAAAMIAMHEDMDRPRCLTKDALVVQRLYALGPGHWMWYEAIHRILIDAYGTQLLMRRISAWYALLLEAESGDGNASPSDGAFGAIADVQLDDAHYRAGALRERDRRFWHEQYRRPPEICSLADTWAPAARQALVRTIELPATLLLAVHTLADDAEVPWPDVLVTLIAAYLTRHTAQEEIVVGVPYLGRLGLPAAQVPTLTMNVLPMRLVMDEGQAVPALVAEVSDCLRLARRHGRYRSEQLRIDLGLQDGERHVHGPIINVEPFGDTIALREVDSAPMVLGSGPVDDLIISVRGGMPDTGARAGAQAGARLEFEANPGRYTVAALDAHLQRLSTYLQDAVGAATLAAVPR